MRVIENREGITTLYVYNKAGNLLGEYTAQGAMLKEHVYLGSKQIATITSDLAQSKPTADAGANFSCQ